jgi:hypothetical protein
LQINHSNGWKLKVQQAAHKDYIVAKSKSPNLCSELEKFGWNKMKATELLGVLLRAGGVFSAIGVFSDLVRLSCTLMADPLTQGDTWQRETIGAVIYLAIALILLLASDRIVSLLYPRDQETSI